MFKIIKKDSSSRARLGVLETTHGLVETPAYVMVATHGQIRCLPNQQLPASRTQIVIANTYHLWQNHQGADGELDRLPDLYDLLPAGLPTMTDSGGFQVFSLGFSREQGVGKIQNIFPHQISPSADLGQPAGFKRQFAPEKNLARITKEGVWFRHPQTGREDFLSPELSIKIQEKLGGDIILAFDECTSPLNDYQYTKEALERTHRWAEICLRAKSRNHQKLFGIIQGGEFRDLREKSACFIGSLPFDGLAIGGSLGKSKDDAWKILKWTIPWLDEQKPRHFLGIGKIEDIFESVEHGLDIFDCVIPTREARHGRIWTKQGHLDITKTRYLQDCSPPDPVCLCPVCQITTRSQLHRQFKDKEPAAGQNATLHNVFFFNNLMSEVRQAIFNNRLGELKKEYKTSSIY